MNNCAIKAVISSDGAKIIEYFKSLGIDTEGYCGLCCEEDGDEHIYYGVINDKFDNFTLNAVLKHSCKILSLNNFIFSLII